MKPVIWVGTSGNLWPSEQCLCIMCMEQREPMFLVLGISRNHHLALCSIVSIQQPFLLQMVLNSKTDS